MSETIYDVAVDLARRLAFSEASAGWSDLGHFAVSEHANEAFNDYMACINAAKYRVIDGQVVNERDAGDREADETRRMIQERIDGIPDVVPMKMARIPADCIDDMNPVDAFRCPHCGFMGVVSRHHEDSEGFIDWADYEFIPGFCPDCGSRLEWE